MEGESLNILLVEDNLDHMELIRRSLSEHHIANQIVHLNNGEAALDYLLRRGRFADPVCSPRPHLILLDLRLPKIDGLEVLREIKETEATRRIPVVVITTSEADQDITSAYEYRANSYLVKPIGFGEFRQLIDDLGFYWLGWNQNPWSLEGRVA